ncbi:MAG: hypothetical protein ACKOQY_08635 [Bacteroidota bacterium]
MPDQNRIAALEAMLREDPLDAFCRYALALEYAGLESGSRQSIELLQDLLADTPAYLPAYYQLGKILGEANRKPEALLVIQQGILLARSTGENHALAELTFLAEDYSD